MLNSPAGNQPAAAWCCNLERHGKNALHAVGVVSLAKVRIVCCAWLEVADLPVPGQSLVSCQLAFRSSSLPRSRERLWVCEPAALTAIAMFVSLGCAEEPEISADCDALGSLVHGAHVKRGGV